MSGARRNLARGVIIAVAVVLVFLGVLILLPAPVSTQGPALSAAAAAGLVERGKYLAAAGNCVSCHSRPGGPPFAGGVSFKTPFGTLYSSNITPDNETGIGAWTSADLRRAMHEGITPGGKYLFPAFPYPSFTRVSDADADAIYAYLRTVAPQRATSPPNSFLLQQRWALRFWNRLFVEPGRFVPDAGRSMEWNRGAYLVEGLGHCSACHTPRNVFMAEKAGERYAGGSIEDEVAPNRLRAWSGVNLTSAREGLGGWSVPELAKYLKTGFAPRAGTFGPMNQVIVGSLNQLTAEDTRAMATYLKSLPAHEHPSTPAADEQVRAGKATYEARCEKCHLASGRGGMFAGPPISGSAVVQAADPASLLNLLLYGPKTPKQISFGGWETMQAYGDVLSDAQLADLASYIRSAWGNRAGAVAAADVARQR